VIEPLLARGDGATGPTPAGRPALGAAPLGGSSETVRVTDACTACGACLATCPEGALRRAPKRPAVLDAACTACWACIEICPAGAIVEVR
jgi:ferredoxin